MGGGGPVAVDAQQNVYVIQANLNNNGYQRDAAVFRYVPGSTQGTPLFTASELGARAMTVAADGTVYIAGLAPNTSIFSVVKFMPPLYTPQVLSKSRDPRYPTGISVDAAGNLFVGYLDSFRNILVDPCASGCIRELPAGEDTWILRIPDLAANAMAAGPFITTDGSLIFWTDSPGRFDYIETVPTGRNYPEQILQVDPTLLPNGNITLAYNGAGTELWASETGFSGGFGTNVLGVSYPSGTVTHTFPVDSPANLILITGIAVSPAYFP